MTISGSSFGTKPTPAPLIWDNVESGAFSSKWQGRGDLRVSTESRHSHSAHSGTINFQGSLSEYPPLEGRGTGGAGYFTGPDNSASQSWFAQYWFKLDNNFDWGTGSHDVRPEDKNLSSVKLFRMGVYSGVDENFVLATMGFSGGSLLYSTEYIQNGSDGGAVYFGNTSAWAKGVWHLFQFEFKESSMGVNDGIFRWWVDGALFVDDHDIKTREDFAQFKRPHILGLYNSWNDSGTDRDDFYIDDAYIDTSWSRVEIGNNANYSSCTHREVQIPTAWSTNQISVTVNTGSFQAGSPMYMYVVNSNGQASPGYLLTGSGPSPSPTLVVDTLAPAEPQNLTTH